MSCKKLALKLIRPTMAAAQVVRQAVIPVPVHLMTMMENQPATTTMTQAAVVQAVIPVPAAQQAVIPVLPVIR